MVKTQLIFCAALVMLVTLGVTNAYADTVEVQVTENGFSVTELTVNSGDSVKFINAHVKANGNIEPHCISDPYAQPYTEESCWIIDGSTSSWIYLIQENQVFYDRFSSFTPVTVTVGEGISTTTYVTEEITSAPEYTGDLSSDMVEITNNLTNALETISNLQTQLAQKQSALEEQLDMVTTMQSEITVLESQVIDVSPYEQQINSLTEDRDQWKQTAENWYGVALEQMRVMVEVLGL
jgi:flagellin-like hook-associated protein FlgL|tara:strand:- start:664 stop:1374 length:711 start_codon:yes stop_codon:yes gene_type:complete